MALIAALLKETETKGTKGFFVTFLSLVIFQLGEGAGPVPLSGYAYERWGLLLKFFHCAKLRTVRNV